MNFFRTTLMLALLLCVFNGASQIKFKTYTTATDTCYWKRYMHVPKPPRVNLKQFTAPGAASCIESFLGKCIGQFPQFTTDSLPKHTLKELKKCLFPVDINGDNLPDIIFSGFSGSESDIIQIYLNRKDSFELVFEDYQYITKFRKAAGKLAELQTGDVGCSGDYLYFTREYRVGQDIRGPVFVKVKQHVVYQYTEEPIHYYAAPVQFSSKADTMLLRASAAKINEPFLPDLGTFGNIVAKYRSKSKGLVLANKSLGKGNDWYFVEIFPDTYPSASVIYDLDKMPTFIRGWVSGQAILRELK